MNSRQLSDIEAYVRNRDVTCGFLFGCLFAIGFVNGISESIARAIAEGDVLSAAFNGFNVSFFVWLSFAIGLLLVLRAPPVVASRRDWALASMAGLAMLLPVPALSWLGYTGLALALIGQSSPSSRLRRGAIILLAVTIPLFWARIAMSLFSDVILAADATLTSLAVGTEREGNLVPFADGSGAMWIAPDCSSFTNLSLAVLAFVALVNATSGTWSPPKLGLAVLTCAFVVAINVTRISLIGYYPEYFALIHGQVGASIAGFLTTLVIVSLGWFAVRHDALDLG